MIDIRTTSHVKPLKLRNLGLSLMLALAGWVAPWALWASRPAPAPRRIRGPAPEISYVRRTAGMETAVWSPVLISLPDRLGLGMARHGEERPLQGPLRAPAIPPAYAAPSWPLAVGGAPFDGGSLFAPVSPGRETYRPRHLGRLLVPRPAAAQRPVVVVVAPALQAAELVFPDLTDVLSTNVSVPRSAVSVNVILGSDGHVQHALLETGSENAELDGRVLRAVRRGTAARGTSASGLVQVFFPMPREADGNRSDRG